MKLGIMQPYFLPYVGYFQLIAAVDKFVIYDNIQYTKKGWINRNRMLASNTEKIFTLPLEKDSDYCNIGDRYISDTYNPGKLLNQIHCTYHTAPYYKNSITLIAEIITYKEKNLYCFLKHSLLSIMEYFNINTQIIDSSSLNIDHFLKSEQKVIAIAKNLGAKNYYNPIGGINLYSSDKFWAEGISLKFLQSSLSVYNQFSGKFIPGLSIMDVMMFNSKSDVIHQLNTSFTIH